MTKSIGTLFRPTLVSMQRGLFEARNTVLNWAPICLTAISPLSPPEAWSRTCPTRPSLPPSHDNSGLQEAVRDCSAGFASPLLPPHIAFSKSFGTVVHGLVVSHRWDQHTRPYVLFG
jgi:hypothetical protein